MISHESSYIFISYTRKDAERVMPILQRMERDGFRILCSENVNFGIESDEGLAASIANCGYFIAFMSENYLSSNNCKDELIYARGLGKQQLLVYIEDLELPQGIAMRIGRNQAIFSHRYEDREDFFAKLYDAQNIVDFSDNSGISKVHHGQKQHQSGIRKNRAWVLAAVAAVLILAAVGAWLSLSGREQPAQPDAAQTQTLPTEPQVPDNVLVDSDQIKVTALDLAIQNDQLVLSMTVENKTGAGLYLSVDNCYVNGMLCDPDWGNYLAASQSGMVQIPWNRTDLSDCGIDPENITAVECTLSGQDSDGTVLTEELRYYPQGKENVQYASYAPRENDVVLLDTEEFFVAALESGYSEEDGQWVQKLVLCNRTGEDVTFSAENEAINGFVSASEWTQQVRAGKTVFSEICYPQKQWRPMGYDRVLIYTGELKVSDLSQSFTIYPEGEKEADAVTEWIPEADAVVFENESVRVTYLGVAAYSEENDPADLFCVQNLLNMKQEITFRMDVENAAGASFYETLELASGAQTIVSCERTRTYGEQPIDAALTLQVWNRKFGEYEMVEDVAIRLDADI